MGEGSQINKNVFQAGKTFQGSEPNQSSHKNPGGGDSSENNPPASPHFFYKAANWLVEFVSNEETNLPTVISNLKEAHNKISNGEYYIIQKEGQPPVFSLTPPSDESGKPLELSMEGMKIYTPEASPAAHSPEEILKLLKSDEAKDYLEIHRAIQTLKKIHDLTEKLKIAEKKGTAAPEEIASLKRTISLLGNTIDMEKLQKLLFRHAYRLLTPNGQAASFNDYAHSLNGLFQMFAGEKGLRKTYLTPESLEKLFSENQARGGLSLSQDPFGDLKFHLSASHPEIFTPSQSPEKLYPLVQAWLKETEQRGLLNALRSEEAQIHSIAAAFKKDKKPTLHCKNILKLSREIQGLLKSGNLEKAKEKYLKEYVPFRGFLAELQEFDQKEKVNKILTIISIVTVAGGVGALARGGLQALLLRQGAKKWVAGLVGRVVGNGVVFTATERTFNKWILHQAFFDSEKSFLKNLGEFGYQAVKMAALSWALETGLSASRIAYLLPDAVKRGLPKELMKEGALDLSKPGSRELLLQVLEKEVKALPAAQRALLHSREFMEEMRLFLVFQMVESQVDLLVEGKGLSSENLKALDAVINPEAFPERAGFLIGLKLGNAAIKPVLNPLSQKIGQWGQRQKAPGSNLILSQLGLENLDGQKAIETAQKIFGLSADQILDPAAINARFKNLLRQHHSDLNKNGNNDAVIELNALRAILLKNCRVKLTPAQEILVEDYLNGKIKISAASAQTGPSRKSQDSAFSSAQNQNSIPVIDLTHLSSTAESASGQVGLQVTPPRNVGRPQPMSSPTSKRVIPAEVSQPAARSVSTVPQQSEGAPAEVSSEQITPSRELVLGQQVKKGREIAAQFGEGQNKSFLKALDRLVVEDIRWAEANPESRESSKEIESRIQRYLDLAPETLRNNPRFKEAVSRLVEENLKGAGPVEEKLAARSAPEGVTWPAGIDIPRVVPKAGVVVYKGKILSATDAVLDGEGTPFVISFGEKGYKSYSNEEMRGANLQFGKNEEANQGQGAYYVYFPNGTPVKVLRSKAGSLHEAPQDSGASMGDSTYAKMRVEIRDGDILEVYGRRYTFRTPQTLQAEIKALGEIRAAKNEIEALKGKIEHLKKQETPDAAEIAVLEKSLAQIEATYDSQLARALPNVVQDIADSVFNGRFEGEDGRHEIFSARGRVFPEARIALRDHMVKVLSEAGIKLSTDNTKAVDSVIDLAITAKTHGIIDQPNGLSRQAFAKLVGELYFHNNPNLRIGSTELTHVPMVVEGTMNHFEMIMKSRGETATPSQKKAMFLAALLHDAGKWDPNIKTTTGYTLLASSPFNKTGKEIVVKSWQSLNEALKEQGINPSDVKLPFDGIAAIMVHHDAANVQARVKNLVDQGLLPPLEGQQVWEAIQYHGFVSSWIVNNSLGGLGIKSHTFSENFDAALKEFLEAYQEVSKKLDQKGIKADLKTLLKEGFFSSDVESLREIFKKLPPFVQALMLGDHQGQIDIAKYMTILSGVPANKDASVHTLLFGNSLSDSVLGVLKKHAIEQQVLSPKQGEISAKAFDVAQKWLQGEGLAKALRSISEFKEWAKDHPRPRSVDAVHSWLRTVKVKIDGKLSPEFIKIQAVVEKAFYEFYALNPENPLAWNNESRKEAAPPPPPRVPGLSNDHWLKLAETLGLLTIDFAQRRKAQELVDQRGQENPFHYDEALRTLSVLGKLVAEQRALSAGDRYTIRQKLFTEVLSGDWTVEKAENLAKDFTAGKSRFALDENGLNYQIEDTSRSPLPLAAADGESGNMAKPQSLPFSPGVLETGGRSYPGAVLIPHQTGEVQRHPQTRFRNLKLKGEIDLQKGVIHFEQDGRTEPLLYKFDPKNPPDFVKKWDPKVQRLDVIDGPVSAAKGQAKEAPISSGNHVPAIQPVKDAPAEAVETDPRKSNPLPKVSGPGAENTEGPAYSRSPRQPTESGMWVSSLTLHGDYTPTRNVGDPFQLLKEPGRRVVVSQRIGTGEVILGREQGAVKLFELIRGRRTFHLKPLQDSERQLFLTESGKQSSPLGVGQQALLRPGPIEITIVKDPQLPDHHLRLVVPQVGQENGTEKPKGTAIAARPPSPEILKPQRSTPEISQGVNAQISQRARENLVREVIQQARNAGIYRNSPFVAGKNEIRVDLLFDTDTGHLVSPGTKGNVFGIRVLADLQAGGIVIQRETVEALQKLLKEGALNEGQRSVVMGILGMHRQNLLSLHPGEAPHFDKTPQVSEEKLKANQKSLREGLQKESLDQAMPLNMTIRFDPFYMALGEALSVFQGNIYFDGSGNIVGTELSLADFASPRGTTYQKGIRSPFEARVVLSSEGTLLGVLDRNGAPIDFDAKNHPFPPGLNENQVANLTALWKSPQNQIELRKVLEKNPLLVGLVTGRGTGGLIRDLKNFLENAPRKGGDPMKVRIALVKEGTEFKFTPLEPKPASSLAVLDVEYTQARDVAAVGSFRYSVAQGMLPPEVSQALDFVGKKISNPFERN